MYRVISVVCLLALPAHAETLTQQVAGAWTLTSGSEVAADGTKTTPWASGSLILDPSGRMAFFVFGKDRATPAVSDPRVPAGPMVAYYGTYTADDDTKTLTFRIEAAASPAFNGMTRMQAATLTDDTLTLKGSVVKTPQGDITPINVWRRAK